MALETALTRNLEIPIAIFIAGIIYLALLYSVILYLELIARSADLTRAPEAIRRLVELGLS